jgi:photosystem II stability/assembly factor-like uncharacterized protein
MGKQITKQRRAKGPDQRSQPQRLRGRAMIAAAIGAAVILGAIAAVVALRQDDGGSTRGGLPNTSDYHSLLVSISDPEALVLGTHDGLYRSSDGGRTWTNAALGGRDAMNLSRAETGVVWVAGHNVLARSNDGGKTWQDVRPPDLPSLDVHGFTVDPRSAATLYAAVAGEGLYRSRDGGKTFSLVSREVGPGVFGLGVTREGTLLAAEPRRGLFASNDAGQNWKPVLTVPAVGVAVNPTNPKWLLATGNGIFLSRDGGRSWKTVRELADGAGPVAWSTSNPQRAYVVGFDRTLYRSDDGGASWRSVTGT